MNKIKTGKGLNALIPIKPRTKSKKEKENVYYVEIRKIKLSPEQLKKEIDKKVLKELTESIRKYGVIQPLTLIKVEKRKKHGINVYYKLFEGRKRFLAAKGAGLRVVPAKIKI
ncbi:MAG: ParB N-terminal domain-containing protein [Patescibacteria group bacterium]